MTATDQAAPDNVLDTLIDCMTSFGIHGTNAAEAAAFILSESSGLIVREYDEVSQVAVSVAWLSDWIDSHPANLARDPEAAAWSRLAKIGEEFGEVVAAYIGATGQNPRKGITHQMYDVEKELLDVALTALAAYEHLTGNTGRSMDVFASQVARVVARARKADTP